MVPPDGFLAQLHARCRAHGVPMICDEVKMGLGRPGTLHAFEHDGVAPDIVTFGKVLGGGLPLSAAVGPAEILDEPPAAALLTTAGNPVCTAAGRAVLATIVADRLADHAAKVGAVLADALRGLAGSPGADRIGEVRGRGLAIGLELVDPQTGDRDPRLAAQVVYRAWELGAVVFYVGGNVLEITPPLVLTEDEAVPGRRHPRRRHRRRRRGAGRRRGGCTLCRLVTRQTSFPVSRSGCQKRWQTTSAASNSIDHHVHGAFNKPVDRAGFEASINEGSTDPVPDFMTMFDSPLGLSIRRWCAPVLGLPAHAPADDYWARRSEFGPDELTTAMLTRAGVSRWIVDTGFKGDLLTTPEQMADLSGRPASSILRLERLTEDLLESGTDPVRLPRGVPIGAAAGGGLA